MTDYREIPITFSASMIRAEREGRKTQTRRILKNPRGCPADYVYKPGAMKDPTAGWWQNPNYSRVGWSDNLPYNPGNHVWVRETYYQRGHWEPIEGGTTRKGNRPKGRFIGADHDVVFDAPKSFRSSMHKNDPDTILWHKRLARFMPRRYSRTMLLVTGVKVERLQDISEEDAVAEGCVYIENGWWTADADNSSLAGCSARGAFYCLWNHIHGPSAWDQNPWVVAVTFERVTA